jgi:hypothetical protein
MEYAIINSDNIVENVITFDNEPTDITPFLDAQKVAFNNETLIAVKITPEHTMYGIGNVFNGERFMPQQPYPSWIWDETKYFWVAPKLHPELLYGNNGAMWVWDEDTQEWIATRP